MDGNDMDRLIAAHREEGRKTRRLLAWLLVGIPVAAGLIWGVVTVATLNHGSATVVPATSTVPPGCVYTDGQPNPYDVYCTTTAP